MKAKPVLQFLLMGPILVSMVILAAVLVSSNLDGMLGFPRFSYEYISMFLSSLLLCGGLGIVGFSGIMLYRGGGGLPYGDVVKSLQTRRLVTSGPYRFSRNPMILGYLLILSSIGLYYGSISGALVIPVVALLLLSIWVKLVEEEDLEKRFGADYRQYRETVPFLLPSPRIRPRKQ